MKFYLLLVGLFLIHAFCQGQNSPDDTLLRHYYQYPQEALQAAAKMYDTAQSEHNTPLLIKSLILKTTFSLQINQDTYPETLKQLEKYITQEKDIPARCILHSYAAELYLQYYSNNDYTIRQRKSLQGKTPENIAEWSSNLFQEKILNHFSASINPQKILQQTPVNTYQMILIRGNASDSLRPTLYDFLCHRAIDKLSRNDHYFNGSYGNEDNSVLGNIQAFLQQPVTVEPLNAQSYILKFWQELLRFRLQTPQEDALLMADLERLDYYFSRSLLSDKESLYSRTLKTMQEKFSNTPMVVEILSKEAALLLDLSPRLNHIPNSLTSPSVSGPNIEKALALCKMGIKQFPHYNRINLLYNLLHLIQAPELQTSLPRLLYPGEKLPIKISSRNLSKVNIQLNQIHSTTEYFWNNRKEQLPETQISATFHRLQNDLNTQDTTIFIPVPKAGLYKVIMKAPGIKDSIAITFICSQLFCASQIRLQQRNFQVNDWVSGQPIPHAKILIYTERYPQLKLADSVFTNEKGFAVYPVNQGRTLLFEVVNQTNPNGNIQNAYGYSIENRKNTQVTFITDRSIYRPGQVVYFQGISWKATTDTIYPVVHKKINVQLKNRQSKTIAELKALTDSFGSFTGNFVLPTKLLNGNYWLTSDIGGRSMISIEEYKRPEFDITFQEPRQTYYVGDSVQITGQIKSFSGILLSNQKIQYEISSSFWEGYALKEQTSLGHTLTNPQGNFTITFKAQPQPILKRYRLPLVYTVKAKVTDSKGETQENHIIVMVYAGIAAPDLIIPQQINKTDSTPFIIALSNLPPQVKPQTISYSISQLKAPATMISDLQMPDTIITRTVLQGKLQMSQKDTLYPALANQPSGAYLFTAKHGDTESKHIFYLYSSHDKKPPVPTYTWLIKEKTTCSPGDTARIQFGTSAQNAYILYEIYSAKKLIRRNYTRLSDEIMNINIPYLAQYGKTLWLSIYYVKDKKNFQETIPIEQKEENRSLIFRTLTFRDHLLPGQQEEWKIRILNAQGRVVPTQAVAFMYDASLDKLAPHVIDFHPTYRYPGFRFTWEVSNDYESYYWGDLFTRRSNSRSYPAFQFDKLNTFANSNIFYSFADYSDAGDASLSVTGAQGMPIIAQENAVLREQPVLRSYKEAAKGNTFTAPIEFRTDFQETAFFYPQLQTDSLGDLDIRFKAPQTLTSWKLNILAYTQKLANGIFTRYITTSKPLMVRPNLPRFFRSGDRNILKVTVSNLSDSLQQGKAGVELFLPGNQQILFKQSADFQIQAKGNQTLDFDLKIPENTDLIGCRIFAGNANFSDGEQHLLPVLPNETLLTETLPIYTAQAGTHTYTLDNSSTTRKDYRLTLELSANPVWYAVLALPSLTEPRQENVTSVGASFYVNTIAHKIIRSNPEIAAAIRQWKNTPGTPSLLSQLERNPELKSILLEASPWMLDAETETEQMQKLTELFDENRLRHLQEQALKKLAQLQNSDGGWSWFKGMYSSRFMTNNVLAILARSTTTGDYEATAAVKMMELEALRYLDKQIMDDYKNKNNKINYNQLLYLYTRSLYRDIPLGDALEAHKYYIVQTQKHWPDFSLYEKAISAVALYNYGFKSEAGNILKSLRQYAETNLDNGMYWPNNRNQYYRNSAVQIHTAIMEAFTLIEGNTTDLNLMKQWLLRQKQVQSWGSVPATIDAIYALLLTGNDLLSEKEQLTVMLGNQKLSTSGQANPLGYLKKSYSSTEIQPDMLTVKITKQKDTPSWGGLYLQYFEKLNQVKKQKTDLSVDKKLYVEKINAKGESELFPLETQLLKTGDKVVVRLTLTLNRDMEFLHLKDLRAGCFEPVEQLSGNQWKFGTVYYQEVKNAATNFFFNALSRGTYVIEYPVWINQAGTYQDGMATFQSIYAPEYNAHSNTQQIEVKP